jgi:hypothetical protein
MKIVKVSIELVIDDTDMLTHTGYLADSYDTIANYLNDKLYNDPEFFGDFGPENIESVKEFA